MIFRFSLPFPATELSVRRAAPAPNFGDFGNWLRLRVVAPTMCFAQGGGGWGDKFCMILLDTFGTFRDFVQAFSGKHESRTRSEHHVESLIANISTYSALEPALFTVECAFV